MGCVPFAAGQAKARPRHRTRHSKSRFHTQNKNQEGQIKVQQTPCNIYLGENFATKLQAAFQFERSLQQADFEDGFVQCRFDPFKRYHEMTLSGMAARMKECPNAGGDSVESEVLSLELLHRCFGAKLLKTEMEVKYFPYGGSIVDYTCEMFGVSLGVSVTRAMKYKGEFEKEDAEKLLGKKLRGIVNATQNALDKWSKQILHIWATSSKVADVLTSVYRDLSPQLRINTVVLVTIVTTPQHSLFKNSR
ncbi:AAC-rich mRNA clone AAC4 protein [Strongylocentrotus purpuratus]|uniref:Uncharacterized protein n=1 Tax=Strongylocentrotus purpuratus TaxID=7668 RepID=A0A7M7TH69_STRPU|nr:AAC-rich mRNA clone AAC4 protein [Strongylocentrotus purpuratus]